MRLRSAIRSLQKKRRERDESKKKKLEGLAKPSRRNLDANFATKYLK